MRDSVNPALAACLYSLILIASAFLMARQSAIGLGPDRQVSPDGLTSPSVLRATAIALCLVALLLPMARIVGTTAIGELMLLGGAMVAAGAAMVQLMRVTAGPDEPAGVSRATSSRMQNRRYDDRRAGERVVSRPEPDDEPGGPQAVDSTSDRDAEHVPASVAALATRTLEDVEDVVDGYVHRLGLIPDSRAAADQRGAPGTDRGSKP